MSTKDSPPSDLYDGVYRYKTHQLENLIPPKAVGDLIAVTDSDRRATTYVATYRDGVLLWCKTGDVALPAPRVDHEPPRTASTREEAPRRRAREHAPQFSPNLARIASCACGWRPAPDTPDTDVAHVTHALAAEGRLP